MSNTEAQNVYLRRWRKENVNKVRAISEKGYRTVKGRARNLFHTCKSRAKKKSLDFTLTKTWIEIRLQLGVCELTGLPFSMDRDNPFTPSVDRIDTSKGYTEDNCRLICWL